ncbi:unnamed protein product [Porites lobata]|uniref:Uncharacterized protein n=1 Tax=Porites lobata TaxID=104759 RepID=A0ABN8RVE9_9CNID|nr:unnamed protein product [Porites lobata]
MLPLWLKAVDYFLIQRPKEQIEVAVLLRNIAQHGIVISGQICETASRSVRFEQWQNRQLRQRQRTNYKRLWSQVPLIFVALQFIVIIIVIELFQLPKNRDQSNRNTFTRFIKRCLQCTENMESLSSTTKNRWDECSTTAKMLVECVEHYYAKRCEVVS